MRRNPACAVDYFRRNEGSNTVKDKILTWKRAMRALEPENADQDYTNLEKYRPQGTPEDGTSSFHVNAQIPGRFAQSPLAKENWPLGEPTINTAIKQVRKPLSEEAKQAARERIAKARAIKAAKQSSSPQNVPVEN